MSRHGPSSGQMVNGALFGWPAATVDSRSAGRSFERCARLFRWRPCSFPQRPDCAILSVWAADRKPKHAGPTAPHFPAGRLFQPAILSFAATHPIMRMCSTNRKEVIRCRVISFSRTWPQRIALSGSSLPVKARDARQVTRRGCRHRPRHGRKHGRPPASKEAAAFSFCGLLGQCDLFGIADDFLEGGVQFHSGGHLKIMPVRGGGVFRRTALQHRLCLVPLGW